MPSTKQNHLSIEDICSATSHDNFDELSSILDMWECFREQYHFKERYNKTKYCVYSPSVTYVSTDKGVFKLVGMLHPIFNGLPLTNVQRQHNSQIKFIVTGDPLMLVEQYLADELGLEKHLECMDHIFCEEESPRKLFWGSFLSGLLLPLSISLLLYCSLNYKPKWSYSIEPSNDLSNAVNLAQITQLRFSKPPCTRIPQCIDQNGNIQGINLKRSAFLAQCAILSQASENPKYTTIIAGASHIYEIAYFLKCGVKDREVINKSLELVNNPTQMKDQYSRKQKLNVYLPIELGLALGVGAFAAMCYCMIGK